MAQEQRKQPEGNGVPAAQPTSAGQRHPRRNGEAFREEKKDAGTSSFARKGFKNLLALGAGCLVAFFLLELGLRLFNPIPFRVKGQKIFLRANQSEVYHNSVTEKLDSVIVHTKNRLGFRGNNPPDSLHRFLSLIAVGGSTTECYFSTDGKDWPSLVFQELKATFQPFWGNNAGLDGQSTFGHNVLLNDHLLQLKPKVLLFYVGINDIGYQEPNAFDRNTWQDHNPTLKTWLIHHSEVFNTLYNLMRAYRAKKYNLSHNLELDLKSEKHLKLTPDQIARKVEKYRRASYLEGYRHRLQSLIDTCRHYGILPVFMTQPVLYGEGVDSVTGVDLSTLKIWSDANGAVVDSILGLYNQTTRQVCRENHCPLIDIAAQFPKNSRYYYDYYHYSNEGNRLLKKLVLRELKCILQDSFPEYLRHKESYQTMLTAPAGGES